MASIFFLAAATIACVTVVMAQDAVSETNVAQLKTNLQNQQIRFEICQGKAGTGTIQTVQRKQSSETHVEVTVDFVMTAPPKKAATAKKIYIVKVTGRPRTPPSYGVPTDDVNAIATELAGCDDGGAIIHAVTRLAGTPK